MAGRVVGVAGGQPIDAAAGFPVGRVVGARRGVRLRLAWTRAVDDPGGLPQRIAVGIVPQRGGDVGRARRGGN